ncbi:MAG: hypothetical protein J6K97_01250 [Clostridia bacterium]|nr:hypothetical protein [Clostridia bacterium]
MKIDKMEVFKGDIYECVHFPSVMSNYFVGYGYQEKLLAQGKTFLKLKDEIFVEINDFKKNKRKAKRFPKEAKSTGDIFVKNLTPISKQEENLEEREL